MLPDIRFAIGAVLAGALLIVTAFGLAATVRVAHQRTVGPLEVSRTLAYADPLDWSSRADAVRYLDDPPASARDPLLERLAAIAPDPVVTGTVDARPVDGREAQSDVLASDAILPSDIIPPAEVIAPRPPADAIDLTTMDAPLDVPVPTPPVVVAVAELPVTPAVEDKPVVQIERAPLDRVAALPTPAEEVARAPIVSPSEAIPLPRARPKAKNKVAKRAARRAAAVSQPAANTSYPPPFSAFSKSFFVD